MTTELAIKIFKRLIKHGFTYDDGYGVESLTNDEEEACRLAIHALEQTQLVNGDRAISLNAVLTEVGRWIGYLDEDMISRIQIGIKRLPPVTPCEDAISRDAVLEKAGYTETEEGWCGYTVDVEYIKSLPPVTPQPSEDAISRRKVYRLIEQRALQAKPNTMRELQALHRDMAELPPVTPQRPKGHWDMVIESSNDGYYCSKCHKKVADIGQNIKKFKFCYNCGADMRGNDNEM